MFDHHNDSANQLMMTAAGGSKPPVRASPVRMSHDLYFRPDETTPNAAGGGSLPPFRRELDLREDGPRRSHLWPSSMGPAYHDDRQQRGHAQPPLQQQQQQQQHAQVGNHSSSSLEEGPLENVFFPTTTTQDPSTQRLQHQPSSRSAATDRGFGGASGEINVSSSGGSGGGNDMDAAAAVHRAAFADLKVENRNLRMRLMYMDEIMAKRNIQGTLVNDLADARQEMDMLRRELSEAQRQHELLRKELTAVVVHRDALRDRSEQWDSDSKKLCAIPQLEAALRRVEIERDDAVTKVLGMQLDAANERQAHVERIKQLEEELEGMRVSTEAALSTREDQMIADRMSHQHRIQQLTNEFDAVKADLRAMLEQRSDALHHKEREVDALRGTVVALETDLGVTKQTVDEKDAAIDALQREVQDADVRLRRADMEHQDGCYDRDKKVVALETQVREHENMQASCDDMLLVYKRALQYSMDLLKRPNDVVLGASGDAAMATVDAAHMSPISRSGADATDAVPFLLSPIMAERVSASLLGGGSDASPARSPPRTRGDGAGSPQSQLPQRVTSNAAIVMASVLKGTIDDAAKHAHHERRREVFLLQDRIQRQLGGFQSMLEGLHDVHMTKVRRMSNRIAESCDLTELCARRQTKLKQRHREEVVERNDACQRAEDALAVCRQHLSNAADEHAAVVAELRRLTADRDLERTALTFVSSMGELSDSVKGTLKHAVDEMRRSIVPINVITPDFLEGIRTLARKAHQCVHGLHDVVEVAQRQYHMYVMDQQGGGQQQQGLSSSSSPPGGYGRTASTPAAAYHRNNDHHLNAGINSSSRSAGGYTRSPSSTVGGGDGGTMSKAAMTVENLVNQLVNVCVLLENNVAQAQQSQLKFQSALEGWEHGLIRQWHALEARIADSMLPLRQRYLGSSSSNEPSPREQQPSPQPTPSYAQPAMVGVSGRRTASASPPATTGTAPTLTTHAFVHPLPQEGGSTAASTSSAVHAPATSHAAPPPATVHWKEYLLQTTTVHPHYASGRGAAGRN